MLKSEFEIHDAEQLLIFLYSVIEKGVGMCTKTKINDEKADGVLLALQGPEALAWMQHLSGVDLKVIGSANKSFISGDRLKKTNKLQ